MHPIRTAVLSTLLSFAAPLSFAEAPPKPLASIESLDMARYMGRWFEVSRYPTWFQ